MTEANNLQSHKLMQQYRTAAYLAKEKTYMMFSNKTRPFIEQQKMHMDYLLKYPFQLVVAAFIEKYNDKNKWCCTTICHVEQIDEHSFAFVRRLENVSSSQPLYERIVVDRRKRQLSGFTFERKTDEAYSENYTYSEQADQQSVKYDMYLFRDPGVRRLLRYRMFYWGIDTLKKKVCRLMEAQETLKNKKGKLMEKAAEKIHSKIEQVTKNSQNKQ